MEGVRLTPGMQTRLKSVGPWLLLALWPLALALSNPKWMYNITWNDPYIYLGAFLRLPEQLRDWGDLYFYSRLAFILPGYLAYRLLPPLAANAALDLGYYYASIGMLYVLLRRQAGERAALFTALAAGGYSHFLTAIGWDYVDGAGGMYLLLAVWAVSRAMSSARPRVWMFSAGLALGASVHTHFFTLTFWPVVGLYLLLAWPSDWPRWRLLGAGLSAAAGIALVTAMLALSSKALGGRLEFFMSTYYFLRAIAGLSTNPWVSTPLVELLPSVAWLALPAVAAAAVLGNLYRGIREWPIWRRSARGAFGLCYLVAVGLMLVVAIGGSTPVLSVEYYVSYLIPFIALAVGSLIAGALERMPRTRWLVLLGLLVASVPAAIIAGTHLADHIWPLAERFGGWISLGVLSAALLVVVLRRSDFASLAGAVLAFALVNPLGPSPANSLMRPNVATRRNTFLQVVDGVRAIDTVWPGQEVWLWFNYREDPAYEMIACAMSACHRRVVSREFPRFRIANSDRETAFLLGPGRRVALISDRADAAQAAVTAADGIVTPPEVQATLSLHPGGEPFQIVLLRMPDSGWQLTLPPKAWLFYQPSAASVVADGAYYADPAVSEAGFMAYGPYVSLPPGRYEVTFWLRAGQSGAQAKVADLDVSVNDDPRAFAGANRTVSAADFTAPGADQAFTLEFTDGDPRNLVEFRVFASDVVPLRLSLVQLRWVGEYTP